MRRILFATDFSKASRKAFTTAVQAAKREHATLSIVHALAPYLPITADQYIKPDMWDQIDRDSRRWATRHLHALAAKAKTAGVRAQTFLLDGIPAKEIQRFAKRQHADLLIVGTHGRTGFAKLFLGSVANQIVATSTCPVMTVRGQ